MADFSNDLDHHDNVHTPSHYKYGKKETIEVIQDCMTDDEYHGYLKGKLLMDLIIWKQLTIMQ